MLYDEHAEGAIAEKSAQHYQYKGSYILTSVKSGLMIIDQQRAHIRILYDQYMNQIANRRNVSQRMLISRYGTLFLRQKYLYWRRLWMT